MYLRNTTWWFEIGKWSAHSSSWTQSSSHLVLHCVFARRTLEIQSFSKFQVQHMVLLISHCAAHYINISIIHQKLCQPLCTLCFCEFDLFLDSPWTWDHTIVVFLPLAYFTYQSVLELTCIITSGILFLRMNNTFFIHTSKMHRSFLLFQGHFCILATVSNATVNLGE